MLKTLPHHRLSSFELSHSLRPWLWSVVLNYFSLTLWFVFHVPVYLLMLCRTVKYFSTQWACLICWFFTYYTREEFCLLLCCWKCRLLWNRHPTLFIFYYNPLNDNNLLFLNLINQFIEINNLASIHHNFKICIKNT